MFLWAVILFGMCLFPFGSHAMFDSFTDQWLSNVETNQRNYGVAVADVDHDGRSDMIVAGFSGPNLVLKYDGQSNTIINIAQNGSPFEKLRDELGQAIGVGACDIDGDGNEEIYFLNTNQAYAGVSGYSDKLFKWHSGEYIDLFSDPLNENLNAINFAGRSVACLDRFGNGKYGIIIATYGMGETGRFSLIEMDEQHPSNDINNGRIVLKNNAREAGIQKSTGGRGLVVGSILHTDGKLDIFFGNEGNYRFGNPGDNFLFENMGNGTFKDVAQYYNLHDSKEAVRGITLSDLNRDSLLDIIYGNWDGPHRIYLQSINEDGGRSFRDIATPDFSEKSLVRTVMAADFDNDGYQEIFFNNINDPYRPQPNRLFKVTSFGTSNLPDISKIDIGDALEPDGYGTGGAYADLDRDGVLELLLSHGERTAQSLTMYKVKRRNAKGNNWMRVLVLTKYGAPARGASVHLKTSKGNTLSQIVDSGSGYLCQMEPIAHFGLGQELATEVSVQWPGGIKISTTLAIHENKRMIVIPYPEEDSEGYYIDNDELGQSQIRSY